MDTQAILDRILDSAEKAHFNWDTLHDTPAGPLIVLRKEGSGPKVYLSSGIHGDEPAGVLAIERLLDSSIVNHEADFDWTIFPMLNPTALAAKTRENPSGIDLNRDYNNPQTDEIKAHTSWLKHHIQDYDIAYNLHEDWETEGFYIYALGEGAPELAQSIVQAVDPILSTQQGDTIEGHEANNGVIGTQNLDLSTLPLEGWPETIYLNELTKIGHKFTLETPSSKDLESRIQGQLAAIGVGLKYLIS